MTKNTSTPTKPPEKPESYRIRLYGADHLASLVARAGFANVQVHTDASALNRSADVGCMNHRLVIVARKP